MDHSVQNSLSPSSEAVALLLWQVFLHPAFPLSQLAGLGQCWVTAAASPQDRSLMGPGTSFFCSLCSLLGTGSKTERDGCVPATSWEGVRPAPLLPDSRPCRNTDTGSADSSRLWGLSPRCIWFSVGPSDISTASLCCSFSIQEGPWDGLSCIRTTLRTTRRAPSVQPPALPPLRSHSSGFLLPNLPELCSTAQGSLA